MGDFLLGPELCKSSRSGEVEALTPVNNLDKAENQQDRDREAVR